MLKRINKLVFFSVIGFSLLLFFIRCSAGVLFYENRTSSAPQGVYVRSFGDVAYDDYVIVELDRDIGVLKEGYLLLKRVKGFPGDIYIVQDGRLVVRGQFFPLINDARLPHLAKGSYIVPEGTYLLLNDTDGSFDSRYLGPMDQDRVRAKVKMLVPYAPLERIFVKARRENS